MARLKRSSKQRKTFEERQSRKQNIIGLILILLVVAAAGTSLYFYQTMDQVAFDPETGCPTTGGISLTAVIIDGSDVVTPRQQAFLRNHLEVIKEHIPRGGALAVYKLGTDPEKLLEAVASVCNPGRGSEINPLTGSPRRAEKLWKETFQAELQGVFDRLLDPNKEELSPIFESIQSVGITAFASPQWQDKPKRLVLISDMLQYTPGKFSHYEGSGRFESFRSSEYYGHVRTDLSGVEVTVFYLPRATRNNVQGRAHQDFWRSYFLDQGARPGKPALFVHVEG